jgi:hypothetical protein
MCQGSSRSFSFFLGGTMKFFQSIQAVSILATTAMATPLLSQFVFAPLPRDTGDIELRLGRVKIGAKGIIIDDNEHTATLFSAVYVIDDEANGQFSSWSENMKAEIEPEQVSILTKMARKDGLQAVRSFLASNAKNVKSQDEYELVSGTEIVGGDLAYRITQSGGADVQCIKNKTKFKVLRPIVDFEDFTYIDHRLSRKYKMRLGDPGVLGVLPFSLHGAKKESNSPDGVWFYQDAITGELTGQTVNFNGKLVAATFDNFQNITKQEFQKYMKVPADLEDICVSN